MKAQELKESLSYLINKYIVDLNLREALLSEVESKDTSSIGVKGILHEINIRKVRFDVSDEKLFKEIVFYYS